MRVGFLGIQCDSANLGLAALAYAAIRLTHEAAGRSCEIVLFSVNSPESIERMERNLQLDQGAVRAVPFRHKKPRAMLNSVAEIRACDLIVDFTGGDSFSDIYGIRRLARKLFHKQLVLILRRPLLLAPQTYGPLTNRFGRVWSAHVIERAAAVLSRDDLSVAFLSHLVRREVLQSTDVAVTLPFTPRVTAGSGAATRVGFNVSGLLWNGGLTGKNQFGLTVDYRDYCRRLIAELLAKGHDLHLVPHVVARPWESGPDDDVPAAHQLLAEFPGCRMAPAFDSPVAAKSWISGLDVFIGSRMHATIAAFTSGVATVPAAYSRKFTGFFASLGYPVLVDLTSSTTDAAVALTLRHVSDRAHLLQLGGPANEAALHRVEVFSQQLRTLIGNA